MQEKANRTEHPRERLKLPLTSVEVPTKLVKRTRNSSGAPAVTSEPSTPILEGHRTLRHEEHTSAVVKDFCNVYFDKIKNYPDPKDHPKVLAELSLILPGSNEDIGYAKAFWSVRSKILT